MKRNMGYAKNNCMSLTNVFKSYDIIYEIYEMQIIKYTICITNKSEDFMYYTIVSNRLVEINAIQLEFLL